MTHFKIRQNYIHTCTVRPHDIKEVKNALLKPVYITDWNT